MRVIRMPGRARFVGQVGRLPDDLAAPTDIHLLRAVAEGDSEAFLAIYDRYRRLAFGLAWRILDDPSSAEEVVQDAFMQVWNRAAGFDASGSANVRGWLLTIVHHRAIDSWRRSHRHDDRSVALDDQLELRSLADTWETVDRRLTQEEMRAALDGLPDDQRRAVELAYFGGLTQAEIAEREETPLGTVKGRLRLGLNKLRTTLTVAGEQRPSTGRG
jgi:RNA polymerase sigma-70 factor (ECF subfamily)